ncbi:MAG TPA: energy-coupling factor ABC transporter permease [bacterium]|nr:energy-coupling factor ABC transporter permease [bacterium]
MHVPDGLLQPAVWAGGWALGGSGLAWAVVRARKVMEKGLVPLAGVLAAFIFAAQMLNFPILPGVSGHLVGAALAAIALGPAMGILVIFTVLAVQCLLFADGGVTALGLNTLAMGVTGALVGYGLYRLVGGGTPSGWRRRAAAFTAGFGATVVASAVTSTAICLSTPYPPATVFGLMVGFHALVGVGEGLITVVVVEVLQGAGVLERRLEGGVAR